MGFWFGVLDIFSLVLKYSVCAAYYIASTSGMRGRTAFTGPARIVSLSLPLSPQKGLISRVAIFSFFPIDEK